jgi:beta-galactosidase
MIMCEYAYAKGNSTGNFSKFWDLADELPRFQGGCIWDWHDKALLHTNAEGETFWA